MFNPYVSQPAEALRPVQHRGTPSGGLLDGLLGRLSRLDSDDLLILLLVYLLCRDGEEDGIWPLVAALLYLLL